MLIPAASAAHDERAFAALIPINPRLLPGSIKFVDLSNVQPVDRRGESLGFKHRQ